MRRVALGLVVGGLVLTAAVTGNPAAFAQGNPGNPNDFTNNPHPMMPWTGITSPDRVDFGQTLRYIPVAPQPVTIETLAPTPEGMPAQMVSQVVEIPGYQIVETTNGFFYPQRWTLDQVNVGVYQWRLLPSEFRRKF
jgi:hypothetical protein